MPRQHITFDTKNGSCGSCGCLGASGGFAKRLFVSKALAKQRPGTPLGQNALLQTPREFPAHARSFLHTAIMSALRALRQLTASSSRSLAARAATRSVARSALAARLAPVASRAFSVSARRFGEGASTCPVFLGFCHRDSHRTVLLTLVCTSRCCVVPEARGGTQVRG